MDLEDIDELKCNGILDEEGRVDYKDDGEKGEGGDEVKTNDSDEHVWQ